MKRLCIAAFALCAPLSPHADNSADEARGRAYAIATARFEKMKYLEFCSALGKAVRSTLNSPDDEAARDVSMARYSVSPEFWEPIKNGTLRIGMPLCAAVAAIGKPSEIREIATARSTGYSVYFRDPRPAMLHLDSDMRIVSYTR